MMRPDGHPVVALTLRRDRLDSFWFTLAHELAHVVLHLAQGDSTIFIDDLESDGSRGRKEKEADRLASDLLIPRDLWKESDTSELARPDTARTLAARAHVHPAIVAGRIQYEMKNYKILTTLVGSRMLRKQFPDYKGGVAA